MSTNDSYLECSACGKKARTNFGHSLRNGWPMCCGYTMRLLQTAANIEHAVGAAIDEGLLGARHAMQLPGDKS